MLYFVLLFVTPHSSTLFPYTTLFRSHGRVGRHRVAHGVLFRCQGTAGPARRPEGATRQPGQAGTPCPSSRGRSEEHTSELQSLTNLVCRLLLEKKKAPQSAYIERQNR